MVVYRVGKTKYANDLKGEGARLFGGRWNNKMVGCLYTSESRALAVLEYTVNVNIDDIPRALSITVIGIPDSPIKILSEADLPGDWKLSGEQVWHERTIQPLAFGQVRTFVGSWYDALAGTDPAPVLDISARPLIA